MAGMVRFDIVVAVIGAALFIYALVDCISIYETRIKSLNKISWVFIIILLSAFVGPILWLTLGKARKSDPDTPVHGRTTTRQVAPDDDPVFLQNATRFEAQAERIRRLEAELKALNDEDPGQKSSDT
jgi:hypothetical protein